MSSDVTQFKMEDVQRRVSETIKAQFAMMIPDEAFEEMARLAIKDFFETAKNFTFEQVGTGYNPRYSIQTPLTPFKFMMWERVRVLTEEKLKEWEVKERRALGGAIKKFFETDLEFQGSVAANVSVLAKQMAAAQQMQILDTANGMITNAISNLAGSNGLNMPY